jgi:hypothetical protein
MSADLTAPPLPVVAWEYDDPECGFPGMPCKRHSDVPPGRALNSKPLTYKADADAALASLQARLNAAERDAARYRWLRSPFTSSAEVREMTRIVSELFDEDMDAAIDAATSQEGKE